MDTKTNQNMKTTVFNLIILDESGSMLPLRESTVSGCNEVLNVTRNAQKEAGDKRTNLVSIFCFQSDGNVPSRYIAKNEPAELVNDLTPHDYQPYGGTPLLDAVGSTLTDLKAAADKCEDATGIVTIITDGYENSSTHYSLQKVAKMISSLKELGWTFNFIGANIDVDKVSQSLNIDNAMAFLATKTGTRSMMSSLAKCMDSAQRAFEEEECADSVAERVAMRTKRSIRFFKYKK